MAALAQMLLLSQDMTHRAACAQRHIRQHLSHDTSSNRADIGAVLLEARVHAGRFATYADYHPAANDETPTEP